MKNTTISEFQSALQAADLSKADLDALDALFLSPNSSATAAELAAVLSPEQPSPIVASGAIGRAGRKLSEFLNVNPGIYLDRGIQRPAYFMMIGKYGKNGWAMWNNLRSAMEKGRFASLPSQTKIPFAPTQKLTPARNPKWHRDEIILALDLYFDRERGTIDKGNPKIIELSNILNQLPLFAERPDEEKFRNPNGVTLKLSNFLSIDPSHEGKGMERFSKLDKEVFHEFSNKIEELKALASQIKTIAADPTTNLQVRLVEDDEETVNETITEGQIVYKLHKTRERDKKIVSVKKIRTLSESGKLDCEACAFDFHRYYGELGYGFIECHHRTPLSVFKMESVTSLQDLALVCSNCHRMLHRQISTLTVELLRQKLAVQNKRYIYE